jgi:hypothetical protein
MEKRRRDPNCLTGCDAEPILLRGEESDLLSRALCFFHCLTKISTAHMEISTAHMEISTTQLQN